MMHAVRTRAKRPRSPETDSELPEGSRQPSLTSYLETSLQTIRTSDSSFLVTSSPIKSTSAPPGFIPQRISPYSQKKARYSRLLDAPPANIQEEELQNSLRELLAANKAQKSQIISMQSSLVLNGAYCDVVQGQLAAQEESRKSKQKGRLVGDGLPRLLTSNEFMRRVDQFHTAAQEKEADLAVRRVEKAGHKTALEEWKKQEANRKAENLLIRARWQEDVKAWEQERDRTKLLGHRPSWNKPVLKGKLIAPIPKPSLKAKERNAPRASSSHRRGESSDSSSSSSDSSSSDSSSDSGSDEEE
ncbi:hypothetical protein R3P38DRAFT_2525562 [Favolaschia claudopus]|uniref:Uncharacterized protein n=1 Tax=Favolaschia claudopus TaxID=2862362 RepID=A0AAW0BQW8_9AGAR